jgi:exonuclease III
VETGKHAHYNPYGTCQLDEDVTDDAGGAPMASSKHAVGSQGLEAEQVAIQSSDLTAVVLRLPDRAVQVVSVYVPCTEEEALRQTVGLLGRLINDVRNHVGTRTDIVLAGDLNRHDQLWGGDDISAARQGEADFERTGAERTCNVFGKDTPGRQRVTSSVTIPVPHELDLRIRCQ